MEAQAQQVTHEAERIAGLTVALIALWVILFSALLCVVAVVLYNTRSESVPNPPLERQVMLGRDEVSNVRIDLIATSERGRKLKAEQRKRLSQFEWVDRSRGLVRVPVDVAMDLELSERK